MKKMILATAVAFATALTVNAGGPGWPGGGNNGGPGGPGGNNNGGGAPCTGCTAQTYDVCEVPVTVSLANVLEMDCDDCDELQACANTLADWASGIQLGAASFSVASTSAYSVYAGTSGNSMIKAGGGTPIQIGPGAGQISILGKIINNNTGGTNAAVAPVALGVKTGTTAATAGTKVIDAAPASLVYKSAGLEVSTGPLPLNVASGDYSVDVVISAIQD